MLKLQGTLINPAHVESARLSKNPSTGIPMLTLIHAKEGQKDYTGDEAAALFAELHKPEPTITDVHAELAAIRATVEEGLAFIRNAFRLLPNAVKENPQG